MIRVLRVIAILYAVTMAVAFFRWDACFFAQRTAESPKVNLFLTSIGVAAQLLHVAVVIYFTIFIEKLPRRGNRIAVIALVLVSTYFFTGAVRHGVIKGDELRAYFYNDTCWPGG